MTARVEIDDTPDLSTPGDLMEAAARTGIHSLLARIPGVSVGQIVARRRDAGVVTVTLDINGWSPTLHGVQGAITAKVQLAAEQEPIRRAPMLRHPALRRLAAIQSARAAAGLQLGLSGPMAPTGVSIPAGRGTISRRMPTEMRHLLVDASLPAVLATAGEDPVSDLADGVRRMHNGQRSLIGGGDDGLHVDGDIWMQEIHTATLAGLPLGAPETLRVIGRAAVLEVPDGMTGSYDGRRLLLTNHGLPETVLAAMPGRRLDQVVMLHPALNHRIVDGVHSNDDTIWVSFTPHLMTLARAIAMIEVDDHADA